MHSALWRSIRLTSARVALSSVASRSHARQMASLAAAAPVGRAGASPGRRLVHVSASMSNEPRTYDSNASADPSRIFADYTIYKKKSALTLKPARPMFKVSQNGTLSLAREGTVLLCFAHGIATKQFDWNKQHVFSLSVSEIGILLAVGPQERLDFYHDPLMGKIDQGKVTKKLRLEPFPEHDGYHFNLSVADSVRNINDRVSVPINKAEFVLMRTAMSYITPYLMGWYAIVNPNSVGPGMIQPHEPSADLSPNNWRE